MSGLRLIALLLALLQAVPSEGERGVVGHLRRLIGSNCIYIERGMVTPYYECIGCVVERATECLTDLRLNKTGSVPRGCPLGSAFHTFPGSVCCPSIHAVKLDLEYMGSAYPQALHCMEDAGCSGSLIYKDLMTECEHMCPGTDIRTGGSICLAQFNAAPSARSAGQLLVISLVTLVGLVISGVAIV